MEDLNAILVSGISKQVSKERLEFLFGNKKRGGPVKELHVDQTKGEAIITFENHDDAKKVAERKTFEIKTDASSSEHLKAEWYRPQSKVMIKGVTEKISDQRLTYFFQNKRRGGAITGISRTNGQAIIEFDRQVDAEKVITQQKFEILDENGEKVILKCAWYDSCCGEKYPNKVLIKCLTKKRTLDKERLRYFFGSSKRGGPIESIEETGENIIIVFKDPEIATKIVDKERFELQSDDEVLTLIACWHESQDVVDHQNKILVGNLPINANEEFVKHVVEMADIDLGQISNIELNLANNRATVSFHEEQDAGSLLSKVCITVNDSVIHISPYESQVQKQHLKDTLEQTILASNNQRPNQTRVSLSYETGTTNTSTGQELTPTTPIHPPQLGMAPPPPPPPAPPPALPQYLSKDTLTMENMTQKMGKTMLNKAQSSEREDSQSMSLIKAPEDFNDELKKKLESWEKRAEGNGQETSEPIKPKPKKSELVSNLEKKIDQIRSATGGEQADDEENNSDNDGFSD